MSLTCTRQCSLPPPSCLDKIGTQSPHLTASGVIVPQTVCFDTCTVSIDVGAAGSSLWVGWGQYTGANCVGGNTASSAPVSSPDVCPAGRTIYNGVCTPLVDIPELGYGGMSISDIQNAIAKSEAAAAAKKKAVEALQLLDIYLLVPFLRLQVFRISIKKRRLKHLVILVGVTPKIWVVLVILKLFPVNSVQALVRLLQR